MEKVVEFVPNSKATFLLRPLDTEAVSSPILKDVNLIES